MSCDRNPVRAPEIGGIRAPDSPLCVAATEFAQRVSESFLFNHAMRSYYFAELVARERAKRFDREVLYVSAVLHDLGLTSIAPVKARFEIEGADAAVDFLSKQGMSDRSL